MSSTDRRHMRERDVEQALTRAVQAHGVTTPRSNQSRFYGGIRLNETAVDDLNTALEDY